MREETLRAANLALVGYHQSLPLTAIFGAGTLSSSDGQRFPTRGKSITARVLSRYFANEGLSTYTHVTDQHATYGTKVIVATKREAPYVVDEILGCWSASCRPPGGRTPSPRRSKSMALCAAPSMLPGICRIRTIDARSPANSTRANPLMRPGETCSTPTRA